LPQLGFIFSGNVGTGIVMLKSPDGTFNQAPPCAVGLTGVGFGLLAGASVKDVVMFLVRLKWKTVLICVKNAFLS